MKAEKLGPVFYVSSKGEVTDFLSLEPIPRNRALVVELSHANKPPFYMLTILNNEDASDLHKARLLKHFLSPSFFETAGMEYAFRTRGQVSLGPLTYEVAEIKAREIKGDGARFGYHFDMILENIAKNGQNQPKIG